MWLFLEIFVDTTIAIMLNIENDSVFTKTKQIKLSLSDFFRRTVDLSSG